MVRIDHELVYEARKLITGANIHRLGHMILMYELAVDLHNRNLPSQALIKPKPGDNIYLD